MGVLLSKTEYKQQDTIFKAADMTYSEYLEFMQLQEDFQNVDEFIVWQTGMDTDSEEEDGDGKESSGPCGECLALEGQIFHISSVPSPPHDNCKCGTIPLRFHIEFESISERLKRLERKISLDNNIKEAKGMSFMEWKNSVKNKGKWDYKQKDKNLSDFGNFNYGATGAAMLDGNSPLPVPQSAAEQILLRGAGYAQGEAGTSKEEWGNWYEDAPYGDDPADQDIIQEGIDYYYDNYL